MGVAAWEDEAADGIEYVTVQGVLLVSRQRREGGWLRALAQALLGAAKLMIGTNPGVRVVPVVCCTEITCYQCGNAAAGGRKGSVMQNISQGFCPA
jgi:hypothetical protein